MIQKSDKRSSTRLNLQSIISVYRSTYVRVFLAFGITTSLFFAIPYLENKILKGRTEKQFQSSGAVQAASVQEGGCEFDDSSFYCMVTSSKLLGLIESFSIVVAAILFTLESYERKKQARREAWKLIDGARGAETSGARFDALEELNQEDNHRLKRLDADGADLIGINLRGADLEKASLKQCDLQKADLEGANLQKADLERANLRDINLKGATLKWAKLCRADLQNSNLIGADLGAALFEEAFLHKANFESAYLQGAEFQGADLRGANFNKADIYGASFLGVKNLMLSQIINSKNWKKAIYDQSFHPEIPDLTREATPEIHVEDSNDSSRHEINTVIEQIDLAINLLSTDTLSSSNTVLALLSEIKSSLERQIEQFSNDESSNFIRNKLADLSDYINLRAESETDEQRAEAYILLDQQAYNWFIANQHLIKSRIHSVLDKEDPMLIAMIEECHEQISQCLSTSEALPFRRSPILPRHLYVESLSLISSSISEISLQLENNPSEVVKERLKGYIDHFLNELEN